MHDGDPEYLCIQAFFNAASSPLEANLLLVICNETSLRIKGVKADVDAEGNIVFSIEMLATAPGCLPTPEHLQAILPRALNVLLIGIQKALTDVAVVEVEDVDFHDEA